MIKTHYPDFIRDNSYDRFPVEYYLMQLIGETADPDNLPRREIEYYFMILIGETPDPNNLPCRPVEYYFMVLLGETPDLENLPRREVEYYLATLIGDDISAGLPQKPLEYYFKIWAEVGLSEIFFRIDNNGDLIGLSRENPPLESQFALTANGDFVYNGSAPVYNSASINANGFLVGA